MANTYTKINDDNYTNLDDIAGTVELVSMTDVRAQMATNNALIASLTSNIDDLNNQNAQLLAKITVGTGISCVDPGVV